MDDQGRLECTVEQLRLTVAALDKRVEALERLGAGAADTSLAGVVPDGREAANKLTLRNQRDPIFVLSLIGRLFLVLAGGFFLRAMTEADVLTAPLGVSLAFAYGLVWLFMSDRAARRTQWLSAVFHAGGAAIVVFPLLMEATLRFKVLGGGSSAIVIAMFTAGFLYVAWRQRLHPIAWIAVVGALPTAAMLLVQTGAVSAFALYLIAFGILTYWLANACGWSYLPWPVAMAANLAVVGVTLRAAGPEYREPLAMALLVQMLLLGGYALGVAIRTLVRERTVTSFEIAQTFAALLIGLGGAIHVTRDSGSMISIAGIACLVAGVACYSLAVMRLDRHGGSERNVQYYASLALVLTLTGCAIVLGAAGLAVAAALLGMLATLAWSRTGRAYMLLHGAVYVVAAGAASGALGYCTTELLGTPAATWVWPGSIVLLVLFASGAAAWFAAAHAGTEDRPYIKGLRLTIVVVSVWVASGCLVGYLAPLAGVVRDGSVDEGALATVRTGVLALGTLFVAWLGRHSRFREWAWIVYPLLVVVGLKMIAQDFKYSRPATLFIALALYGAALIIAPRLRRSPGGSTLARQADA